MRTETQSGSIKDNYAVFLKDQISEFNRLDKEAQEVGQLWNLKYTIYSRNLFVSFPKSERFSEICSHIFSVRLTYVAIT
jgi:hypothetical protein